MGMRLGRECKLYFKRGGYASANTWREAQLARDVSLNLEKAEADVTTRGNDGWEAIVGALKRATVEAELLQDTEDEAFQIAQDSFVGDDLIGVAIMDRAITDADATGIQFDGEVLTFNRSEPLTEAVTVSTTIKPTYSANPPQWLDRGATGTGSESTTASGE